MGIPQFATIAVSDEQPEPKSKRRPRAKHGLEDDLESITLSLRRDSEQECRESVTVRPWRIETQGKALLLVLHDVMVSAFKFGSN